MIPDSPTTNEYILDGDRLNSFFAQRPIVEVDLHPFKDPDNHACLLRDIATGEVIPHHHAIAIIQRLLDGYDLISEEELPGGSLIAALQNHQVIEQVEKWANFNFRPDIERASVYIMEAEGVYKIGFSTQPEKRRKAIQSKEKTNVTLIHSREVDRPYVLEQQLHRRFSDQRLHGEWFALAGFDLDKAITLIDQWESQQ